MKLSKLTIRNYKGIKEMSILIENISVIIGPNNSGKSTILQALEQFASSDKDLDKSLYYRHDTSNPISFHATFTEVTTEEAELHGIRKSLHEETGNFIVRAVYHYGSNVERTAKTTGSEEHDLNSEGWDGKLGGGKNGSHFLSAFPEVIYIPAVKKATDEVDKGASHMKMLVSLYKDIVSGLEEYIEAQEKTKLLQEKINQHNDDKIKYFESEVQSFLKDVTQTKVKFNVDVKPLDEIVSTSLHPLFNYNGQDTKLENQGTGVQRTFIVSVFKGYRNYNKKYASDQKVLTASRRPLIIAIEEPELYLHPHISRVFRDTLYNLADEGFFQIIATSHSPNFIDLSKQHRTLVKLSLDEKKNVSRYQVSSNIFDLPKDERDKFQALLKFNPYVNEVFFADRAILVEGDTEVVALKVVGQKLVEQGILDPDVYNRTSVVNCGGKGTMYVVLNVLNNFGINYTAIHDYDISETTARGDRRSVTTLKSTMTLNHKIERLTEARGNKKYVFQYTFEEEMSPDYEKGSSKSFTAYEYLNSKKVHELPIGFLDIVKSAYGLTLEKTLNHSNEALLSRYNWDEINQAKGEWKEPKEEFVINKWE